MNFSISDLQEIRKRIGWHYDRYIRPDTMTKAEYIEVNLPTVLKNILERRTWENGELSQFDPNINYVYDCPF